MTTRGESWRQATEEEASKMLLSKGAMIGLLKLRLEEVKKRWDERFPKVSWSVRPHYRAHDKAERDRMRQHIYSLEIVIKDLESSGED